MSEEQLYLFSDSNPDVLSVKSATNTEISSGNNTESDLKAEFSIMDIPFLGCDFDTIYPSILSIVPQESVSFSELGMDSAIMSEIICSSICHQINWDFLRSAVLEYTKKHPKWLSPENLSLIRADDIYVLLGSYHKVNCIKAEERASILREVGKWASNYSRIQDVFIDKDYSLKPNRYILGGLLRCSAFSTDPEGKKMNLLLQKLDSIPILQGIGKYAKPAIDYHLLRLYLRRGLLIARTKNALGFVNSPSVQRKEATVAALRGHCSKLLSQISNYSGLSISSVNLVEWHVARSVCGREHPDCELSGKNAQWLRAKFKECPFANTCLAGKYSIKMLLNMIEPSYKGTSF